MESNEGKKSRTDLKEYGLFDPNRRVVDGHTRPCEECGAVDWQLDDTRGEILQLMWLSGRRKCHRPRR